MDKKFLIACVTDDNFKQFVNSFLFNSLFPDSEPHNLGSAYDDEGFFLPDRFGRFDGFVGTSKGISSSQWFNKAIEFASKREETYAGVIFAREDVSVEDAYFFFKVRKALENFSLVGPAGAAGVKFDDVKTPVSWFTLCSKENWSGSGTHPMMGHQVLTTSYGICPEECDLLDGSLIACNLKDILEKDLKFDENIPSKRHFHDLDFCLQAKENGLKITTWPMWTVNLIETFDDEDAELLAGQKYFIKKWNK